MYLSTIRQSVPSRGRAKLEDRKGGFPHSEIAGSKGASASPALIAACHVLHRLSAPRHPSEALQRLIVSQQNPCMNGLPPGKRWATDPCLVLLCQTMSSRTRPGTHDWAAEFFLHNVNRNPPKPAGAKPVRDRAPSSTGMVEPDGIEPTTSCLQSTRSTN